jgi:glucokinase
VSSRPGSSAGASRLACGLDLGGTKLLGVVIDPTTDGPILAEHRVPTLHGDAGALGDVLFDVVTELRTRVQRELGCDLSSVGMGAAGLVDRSGTLRTAPNLPGIIDHNFGALLQERTGLPATVDNDATCAAWGEHERGASRHKNHSLMVTLGTGIGAGITVKGSLLRGAHGFAGEPGHMVVDPSGPPCPCGRRGCWERYASGSGLGRLARDAANAGHAARVVALAGGDPEDVKGEHVTQAAAEGDEGALRVLRDFGWWVALGIANLVNILDSEIVVIGGGLSEAGGLVLDPVRAAYPSLVLAHDHRPAVPIVQAQLGEQAGAIGAALLADARARA